MQTQSHTNDSDSEPYEYKRRCLSRSDLKKDTRNKSDKSSQEKENMRDHVWYDMDFSEMSILLHPHKTLIVIVRKVKLAKGSLDDTLRAAISRSWSDDRPLMVVGSVFLEGESFFSIQEDSTILSISRSVLLDTLERALHLSI